MTNLFHSFLYDKCFFLNMLDWTLLFVFKTSPILVNFFDSHCIYYLTHTVYYLTMSEYCWIGLTRVCAWYWVLQVVDPGWYHASLLLCSRSIMFRESLHTGKTLMWLCKAWQWWYTSHFVHGPPAHCTQRIGEEINCGWTAWK